MSSLPDSTAIDQSLIGVLLADPQLAALMPDGVYYGLANAKAKRFVVVSLVDHVDVDVFGGRAMESALYFVEAVALASTGGDVGAAAARIDALLQDQFWPIAPGLTLAASHRTTRWREKERDDVDPDLLWLRRGARYRLDVSVSAIAAA